MKRLIRKPKRIRVSPEKKKELQKKLSEKVMETSEKRRKRITATPESGRIR